ncbi:MAG TPA: branched-chain amino acid aminotransferase [Amphiplicatus sp.]|nr:branched-chain amino acid aminotransferase [Amphiplicatus sp.]
MVTNYMGAGAPFDDRDGYIWMDGEVLPWRSAKTHVLSHGLHYASAVFEGEKSYHGSVFELRKHSTRLHRSAELLDFEIPISVDALCEATQQVVDQFDDPELYVRPVAWRGSEMMGVSSQRCTVHLAIAAWPTPVPPSVDERMKGVSLDISKWLRTAPTMAPIQSKAAGLYMSGTLAKHAAEARGFDDALVFDYKGRVAEATTANVFFVIGGKICTPDIECILNGITRQTIIRLAEGLGFEVVVRDLAPTDLAAASEAFLTGTAAEVAAVRRIGEHIYTPSAITESLMTAYDHAIGRA